MGNKKDKDLNENTNEEKNLGGRPVKFTREELQNVIDNYFSDCDTRKRPYTFAGLAYAIKVDRQTLYNYKENEHVFFDIIKDARDRIKLFLEELLVQEGKAGQIFLAKNYGYTDKMEINSNNVNINQNIEVTEDEASKILEQMSKKIKE